MKKVPYYVWVDLRLDDASRCVLASQCFYLGKSVEETRRILDGALPDERTEVKFYAPLAGYKPEDHQLCL